MVGDPLLLGLLMTGIVKDPELPDRPTTPPPRIPQSQTSLVRNHPCASHTWDTRIAPSRYDLP